MTKEQFYELFSEAIPRGAKKYPDGVVEVLEVSVERYAFISTGNRERNPLTGMEGETRWFYFLEDSLIKYGEPNDWPSEPDVIIELRERKVSDHLQK